jgi:hypothetical protein
MGAAHVALGRADPRTPNDFDELCLVREAAPRA